MDSSDLHVCKPTEFRGDGIGLHLYRRQRGWYLLRRRERSSDLPMERVCVVGGRWWRRRNCRRLRAAGAGELQCSFAGQSSIFSGGARVQRAVECASGTVSYTALTAAAANQEITIKTGTSGNVRWDQVTVSETDAIHRDVHGSDRFHGPSGIQQLRDDGNAGSAPGVERRLELLDGPANSAATQRHLQRRAQLRCGFW